MISLNTSIRELYKNISLLDENLNNSFISGNKVRKLKGILSGVKNIRGLLTFGTVYSSHCLATAYFGKLMNVPVKLIILNDESIDCNAYPHLKMAQQLGADLMYCTNEIATLFIQEKQKEFNEYLWIPGGAHTLSAAKEYETLFEELFQKNTALRNKIKSVILPFGTGTTALGIYKGLQKVNCNIEVIGVSISRDKEKCEKALIELDEETDYSNLHIIADYAGEYEKRTQVTEEARDRFLKETGVLVDPIYNAKAIACFYKYNLKNTLIINTGGMLNNLL